MITLEEPKTTARTARAQATTHAHYVPDTDDPVGLIESLPRRPAQRPAMRHYEPGYESWMGMLPVIEPGDPQLSAKKAATHGVMADLAQHLIDEKPEWLQRERTEFERSILAIERRPCREGVEILVAHWPKGFTSPVHGHAPGYLYEQVLEGKILVNTYRHVSDDDGVHVVRPVVSEIQEFPNMLVSDFIPPVEAGGRVGYVHSFTALTPVSTIHFLPEHTRDSRDNTVKIEHFEDLSRDDVKQLSYRTADVLGIGDVALVRSAKVTDYGDHFIVIVGKVKEKPHGFRPAEKVIQASENMSKFLDSFTPEQGDLKLLMLREDARQRFLQFHGIEVDGLKVTFPRP
jgi:hypothetical protein